MKLHFSKLLLICLAKDTLLLCVLIFTIFQTIAVATAQDGKLVRVRGEILDERTRKPLVGANVYFEEIRKGAITDADGFFTLQVPAGKYNISISIVGYGVIKQEIDATNDANISLKLSEKIKVLEEVEITEKRTDENVKAIEMSKIQLDIRNLIKIPVAFGEADIIRAMMLQTGVSTVGEGAGGFNVRGGRTDQNLVLLDEAPLFGTSHLLGFFTNVNPDAVQSVSLYKGGIPAQYGGRLSSVLAIRTRSGNDTIVSGAGGVGLMASRFLIEAPIIKHKASILVAARVTYPNYLISIVQNPTYGNSKASFYDINAKLEFKPTIKDRIILSSYLSRDVFRLPTDTAFAWQSSSATFQWNHSFSSALFSSVTALVSDYKIVVSGNRDKFDYELTNTINHKEVKANIIYNPSEKLNAEAGVSTIWYTLNPATLKVPEGSNLIALKIPNEQGREMAVYANAELQLLPSVSLSLGTRYSFFQNVGARPLYVYADNLPRTVLSITDTIQYAKGEVLKGYGGLEPRISLRFITGKSSSLKVSYNRTRQYIHLISNTTAIAPADYWKLSDPYIKPQVSDQYAIGYFQNFKDNGLEASIETYYKDISNIVEYKNGARLLLNKNIEADLLPAIGKAYGVEFTLKKNYGKLQGQIGYTYSRSLIAVQSTFDQESINNGAFFPSNFDRPHNLIITARYPLSKKWTISGNFTYATGVPTTLPDSRYQFSNKTYINFSLRNTDRIPDYHRLDISLIYESKSVSKKYASSVIFSFYNVYFRRNPFSIFYGNRYGYDQAYKLSILGTLIPSFTYNFKF
ncbi:MAG: TonB-dependent receptor [Cytophagales bacterium]|nr:MAG: TonB-dependent receptor [Cytophagales bacterium]